MRPTLRHQYPSSGWSQGRALGGSLPKVMSLPFLEGISKIQKISSISIKYLKQAYCEYIYTCNINRRGTEARQLLNGAWFRQGDFVTKKTKESLEVVGHAFNPSTWEAEAGRRQVFLNSRPAWSTE